MRFMLTALLVLLLAGCSRETPAPKEETSQTSATGSQNLVVVSTNDFHAALDKAEGLATVIRDLRKRYGTRMVYLDAGDLFQGSLEGNFSKGRAVIEFFNLLRPDVVAIGNHEFDYGPEAQSRINVRQGEDGMGNLKMRVKEAAFPMLSANLIVDPPVSCQPGPNCNALGQQTIFGSRIVFERGANKVCVIGVTTPLTRNISSPAFFKGTKFVELKPVVQAEAEWLRTQERCDWVLLLAHEGLRYESDRKTLKYTGLMPLLQQLPVSTIDAVIAGHSHTPMQREIRGVPVVQTGKSANNVGVLHLIHDASGKKYRFDPLIQVPDAGVAFDVTDALMLYRTKALAFKRQIAGSTTSPFLYDKTKETALGNLVADSIRYNEKMKSDFSIINGGAIRASLPRGKISNENVFRLMPFDDSLVIVELTGRELRALIEVACSGTLGLCSQSGLRIKRLNVPLGQAGDWDRDLNGDNKKEEWERNLILDVKDAKGQPLEEQRYYRLATSSYLVEGGDFQDIIYDRIPMSRIHYYAATLIRDLLQQYFQKKSPLDPAHYYSPAHPRILNQPQ